MVIEKAFERMGAKVKVGKMSESWRRTRDGDIPVKVDILGREPNECFDIRVNEVDDPELLILDVQPKDRHLLLMARKGLDKYKFLCGHDERHWFVASIPEFTPVSTVAQAKAALKPEDLRVRESRVRLKSKDRNKRKNAASIRQGEWFFVPEPTLQVDPKVVLKNEPLVRSGNRMGKPHYAEECYRTGGELVYVPTIPFRESEKGDRQRFSAGMTEKEKSQYVAENPRAAGFRWSMFTRNATVYVRGRIKHPDHATLNLDGWHRVLMNTETRAKANYAVVFLD